MRRLRSAVIVAAFGVAVLACARGADSDDGFLALEPEPRGGDKTATSVKVPETPEPSTVDAAAGDDASDASTAKEAAPPDVITNCVPCDVTGSGTYCGVTVTVSPYVTGGPFGGFQSISGTGAQSTITVTFSQAVPSVTVTALDPDFSGNQLRGYSAGSALLATVPFDNDGTPGVFTSSTKSVTHALTTRVDLVPDPRDYLAYDVLRFLPPGCAVP